MKTYYSVVGILTIISGILAGISAIIICFYEQEFIFFIYGLLSILACVLSALPFFTLADLLGRTESLEWELKKIKNPAPHTTITQTDSAPISDSLKDALDW